MGIITVLVLLLAPPAWADVLPHLDAAAINTEVDAVFAKIDAAQATHIPAAGKRCMHPYKGQTDTCTTDADCAYVEPTELDPVGATDRGLCEYSRRYVQLIGAPSKLDGTTTVKPALDTKTPSDRVHGMRDLGFLDTDKYRVDYVMDEYYTPPRTKIRHGYLIHAEVEISGKTWRRTKQYGPEGRGFTNDALSWYQVEEEK